MSSSNLSVAPATTLSPEAPTPSSDSRISRDSTKVDLQAFKDSSKSLKLEKTLTLEPESDIPPLTLPAKVNSDLALPRTDSDATAATDASEERKRGLSAGKRWGLLAIFSMAMFIDIWCYSAFFIFTRPIAEDLHIQFTQESWVITSYAVTFASFLLFWGRVSDLYSAKPVFTGGFIALGVLNAVISFLPEKFSFFILRAFAGIAGSALIPASYRLIVHVFPKEQLGVAFTLYGMSGSIANVTGTIVAGFIQFIPGGHGTQMQSWRWFFRLLAVMILPMALAALFMIPKDEGEDADMAPREKLVRLDVPGSFLMLSAIVLLTLGLTLGARLRLAAHALHGRRRHPRLDAGHARDPHLVPASKDRPQALCNLPPRRRDGARMDERGGDREPDPQGGIQRQRVSGRRGLELDPDESRPRAPFLVPFLLSWALFPAFFIWEAKIPQCRALLPAKTWKIPNFAVLIVFALQIYAWWGVNFLALVDTFTKVRGEPAIIAAVRLLPQGVLAFVVSIALTKWPQFVKKPRWPIAFGMVLGVVGYVLMTRPNQYNNSEYWRFLFPGFIVGSGGMALAFTATTVGVMTSTPAEMAGVAGAVLQVAFQIGSTVGLSVQAGLLTVGSWPGNVKASLYFQMGWCALWLVGFLALYRPSKNVTNDEETVIVAH
ncbi:hypothetical protein A1Q2_03827 [Trichosporon asahii var. asahii CBS 8904]|uniref:Major facilitator superfamily (MFS) profile domain-containing protein n=1 Tax=Trichosporon asahii var. asahii (strain CBS 8904) TaxID=1220162 RepID=K1WKC9_TRIAC|nr:hypothetical protein A1Q2_03827 [Trichosporon asahii var. asahii CBS 8904]